MKTLFKGFASFIFIALLASVAFGQFSRQTKVIMSIKY